MINNANYHSNMNDVEFHIPLSRTVKEVRYKALGQNTNRKINQCILFNDNQSCVRFGRAEPFPTGRWTVVSILYRTKTKKCLAIMALLFVIYLVGIRRTLNASSLELGNTSNNNQQNLLIKEEHTCDEGGNTREEDILDTTINDAIGISMPYEQLDIQELFKETSATEDNDDLTCALCDRYVPNELTELQNYIDSIDDVNEKSELGQIADSNDDACSTHLQTLQGSSPLKSSEDSIEANGG